MADRPRRETASTVAAVAATITAVVAVLIAFLDNHQMRQHNRLSVLPHVRVYLYRDGLTNGEVRLSNEGIGPAIVRGVTIRWTRPGGPDTVFHSWREAAESLRAGGVRLNGWSDLDSASAIGVQREMRLLGFETDSVGPGGDPFPAFVERLRVQVRYTSIYGG